jgi:hypothetical protein
VPDKPNLWASASCVGGDFDESLVGKIKVLAGEPTRTRKSNRGASSPPPRISP